MSALMGNYIALAATTYFSYAVEAKKQSLTTIPKGDGGNGNWWGDRVTGRSWRSLADTQTWSPVCSLYCIKSGWRSYSWWLLDETELHVFSEAPWEKIDKALNFCRCPLKDNAGDNPVCSLTLVSELPDSDSQSFWGLLSTQTCRELNTEGFWLRLQSKLRTGNRFVRESNASDSPLRFCFQVKALLSVNSVVGASDIVHWGQECNRPPSRLEPREASQRPFGALGKPGKKTVSPVSWAVDLLSCEENAARRWFSLGPGRV